MSKASRSKLVIEPTIQYSLVRQLVIQWTVHIVSAVALLTVLQVLLGGLFRPWQYHFDRIWPLAASLVITLLFLAPSFIMNSLKLSNRFVGPIHRLRQQLRQIAEGQECDQLKFRRGDYWQELASEMERALEVLRSAQPHAVAENPSLRAGTAQGIVPTLDEASTVTSITPSNAK
jgi:hypothetical protein